MNKYNIATAAYAAFDFTSFEEGIQYIKKHSLPIVLKADGLAAGKGVLICQSQEEALKEFELMIKQSKFGEASNKVVIEQFLTGIEVSVFVLTNGKEYIILPEAKDYKRIGEGDTGLNTGGMGAISPVPFFNDTLKNKIISKIIEPTINGFQSEQLIYEGFVFIGLMIDNNEPYVIEYNCRMGDPETEVVIPRIKNDLVEIFQAIKKNTLHTIEIVTDTRTATTTVAVSGGYPEKYTTGEIIEGLSDLPNKDCIIFHSGTAKSDENIITNGGRVLAVTAFGENIPMAKARSSQLLSTIHFNNMYFRRDIGFEFI
jgi:phosphoribosylamine--glycine ligase